MRARWLILIIAGAVAIAWVFLFLHSGPSGSGIQLEVLAQTNINGRAFRVVLVSNSTDRLHSFVLWSETTTNRVKWKRETLEHTAFMLKPHEARTEQVPLPTNGQPRITLQCAPIDTSDFRYWRDRMVMLMGRNPSLAYKMYAEPK